MLFHIIVRVRDGATFSLLRGCYALGRAEHSILYANPTTDHVVLARFSVGLRSLIYSDAEKTKMLCYDRCSVSH